MSEKVTTPQYQRGMNPLLQTKRGKVQQRRGALNEQISKQIRLRNGAENLLKATHDKKIRDQISLELSFLDSNLQLLKEELTELNADVLIYQNEKCCSALVMPQLALGLKETKDVDFSISFKTIIAEHYYEDPSKYDAEVRKISDLRKVIRTPPRNENGVKLLIEYYNYLCYVEKRFYSPNRPLNTYFEWYDAITGIPSIQKSVAFEKGSILFNIAALFTQLGANQDRSVQAGLQKCLDYYGRSVGCFHYLKENFSHSPSNDMKSETLAQIQECVWEICYGQLFSVEGFHESFVLAQESSQVSKMYSETHQALISLPFKPYLPSAWTAFAILKRDFFLALAHYFTAVGILAIEEITSDVQNRFKSHFVPPISNLQQPLPDLYAEMSKLHKKSNFWTPADIHSPPDTPSQRKVLADLHLRQAGQLMEECTSNIRLNKSLKKMSELSAYLKKFTNFVAAKQRDVGDCATENFMDLCEPHPILPKTTYSAVMIPPDFKRFAVEDLFAELGPLTVFNAKNDLLPTKIVELKRTPLCPGFGFSVKGDTPVALSSVESGGLAAICGMATGDYITAVNGEDCRWSSHEQVVQLIRQAGDSLTLTLVSQKPAPPDDSSVLSHNSCSTLSSSYSSRSRANGRDGSTNGPSLPKNGWLSPKLNGRDGSTNGASSPKNGWLSSTLPSSFRNMTKNSNKFFVNGHQPKTKGFDGPKTNGVEISTFNSVKSLKDKKKSSWRVKSFLSLKKAKSDSKLNGSILTVSSR